MTARMLEGVAEVNGRVTWTIRCFQTTYVAFVSNIQHMRRKGDDFMTIEKKTIIVITCDECGKEIERATYMCPSCKDVFCHNCMSNSRLSCDFDKLDYVESQERGG